MTSRSWTITKPCQGQGRPSVGDIPDRDEQLGVKPRPYPEHRLTGVWESGLPPGHAQVRDEDVS